MPRGYPKEPGKTWSRQPKRQAAPVKQKVTSVKQKATSVKRKPEQPRRNTMVAVGQANMEAAILSTLQSVCNQLLRLEGAIYARPYISPPVMQQASTLEDTMARMDHQRQLAAKMQEMQSNSQDRAGMDLGCCKEGLGSNPQQILSTGNPIRKPRKTSPAELKAVPESKTPVEGNGLEELSDEDMMV